MKKIVLVPLSLFFFTVLANGEWLNPSEQICTQNYGKVTEAGCKSNWYSAKKICSASDARLPSKDEFKELISSCGGNVKSFKSNKNNAQYQSCYKEKSLHALGDYWSATFYSVRLASPWIVNLESGYKNDYANESNNYVICVR
ncbi:MAG: DUF1566 domain-containing protein [Epsilonproteobacteria bacterium]|nr:DUF1566 domain-containing protein [Campylobacterota bacterium]MBD3839514.1 DUF1566 domain-containing protein [Campylobacterota bacterium]